MGRINSGGGAVLRRRRVFGAHQWPQCVLQRDGFGGRTRPLVR
ncbi:hypothetical protein [Nocardia mangyaensis]|nr:hypothetical protein [Nocardia mangyaensis]